MQGYHCDCPVEGLCSAEIIGEPFADKFSDGGNTVSRPFELPPSPELKTRTWLATSPSIGPTDFYAPMPPYKVLSHELQVIDRCTPNTEWGGGYGTNRQGTYPTIEPTLHAPLEGLRYNFAAMDTEELMEEAQERVAERMRFVSVDDI